MKYTSNKFKCLFRLLSLVFYIPAALFCGQAFAAGTDLVLNGSLSSPTIAPANISTLTYTLTNSSGTAATDIGFYVTLPTDLLIADQVEGFSSCTDGSFTANAGDSSFSADNYRLGVGASCYIKFNVTGTASGAILASSLNSSLGAGADVSTTLIVNASLMTTSVIVSNDPISVGALNTINYTFSNSGVSASIEQVSITLPAGVSIAPIPNYTTDCSGLVVSEAAGAGTISLSSGILVSEASCTASIDILASLAGTTHLVWKDVTTNVGATGKVGVTFDVVREFANLNFSPITVVPGQEANLEVTLTNFDRSYAANSISFTNDLGATLTGLVATGLPLADVCGSGSTLSGTSALTLSGGAISSGSSCSFTIPVTVPAGAALGSYTNTATNISAIVNGSTVNYADVNNVLIVSNTPSLTMSVVEPFLTAGDDVTLRYVLTNLDGTHAANAMSFTSNFQAIDGIVFKSYPSSGFCGTGTMSTASSNFGALDSLIISNASLAAGDSCTFDVVTTLPSGIGSGSYTLSTASITSSINGQTVSSGAPSASVAVNVESAPSLSISFDDVNPLPGSSGVLNFSLAHSSNSSGSATGIGFTIDLGSVLTGMVATGLPIADMCGAGSNISGSGLLTFTSGSLNVGGSCEFSVAVQLPTDTVGSYSFSSSEVSAQVSGNSVSNLGGATQFSISGFSVSKSFAVNPIRVGTAGTDMDLVYTFTNVAGADNATGITLYDDYSVINNSVVINSLTQTDFCGAGSTTAATSGRVMRVTGGLLNAGEQCSLTISLHIPTGVAPGSYISSSSYELVTIGGNTTSFPKVIDTLSIDELAVATSVNVTSPTSISSIIMSIVFTSDVTGFDETDITANNASLGAVSGSGTTYSVEVIPTANGDVTLTLAAGGAQDALDSTILNSAALPIIFEYQTVPLVPTPSLTISAPSAALANTGPISYTINYFDSEQVILDESYITLNKTGTASGDVIVTNGNTSTATVAIDNLSGEGSLGISISAGTARFEKNLAPDSGPSNTFLVDAVKPTVLVTGPSGNQSGSFIVNFDFDENVAGFSMSDITVVNASLSNFTILSANSYSVQVNASGQSTVSVDVGAGAATDSAGNGNSQSNIFSVAFDSTLPTVSISGPAGITTSSFVATIAFSEDVTGFTLSDITLANATPGTFAAINGANYTLSVNPIEQGSVVLSILANVAQDLTGNGNLAATYDVIYDVNDLPVISGIPSTSINPGSSYTFTATASDPDTADILTFSIKNKPSWASFSSETGKLSGVPSHSDIGITSNIVISVTDGNSALVSLPPFDINVLASTSELLISGSPELSVKQDSFYDFTPTVTNGGALSFTISNRPGWASFNSTTGTLSGTPDNADVGTYSGIVITVTNNDVESDSLEAFSIEVVNVNDAPIFTSTPVTEVIAGQNYIYQLAAKDIDLNQDINFSLATSPDWLTLSGNGLLSGTAPEAALGDRFTVVIALTDGVISQPILQEYTLEVIAPTGAFLEPKFYFTPSPALSEQAISLVIETSNTGSIAAESVVFDITLSDELVVTDLPGICIQTEVGNISCEVADKIDADSTNTQLVGLIAVNSDAGFANAQLVLSASNINEQAITRNAQLLVAQSLSLIPGEVLSSAPVKAGLTIDMNGDNFIDLVSFNGASGEIDIRLNDGQGTLVATTSVTALAGVKGIVAGDINGDGSVDLITVGGDSADTIAYLLDASYQLVSSEILNAVKADIALIADLNSDGVINLVLGGVYQTDVAIYTGIGSGNTSYELVNFYDLLSQGEKVVEDKDRVQSNQQPLSNGITGLSLVEVTQGVALVVASEAEVPVLSSFESNGWQVTAVSAFTQPVTRIVLADVNSDGKLDAFSYADKTWSLTFDLLGAATTSQVAFPDAENVIVQDVDDNGLMDILFVTPQGISIWHYYDIDDIRVDNAVVVGADIADVALVDIDNDGDLDLVTFDTQNGLSLWYLNLDSGFGEREIDIALFAQAPNFPQIDQAGPVSFLMTNHSSVSASGVTLALVPDSGLTLTQFPSGCSASEGKVICSLGTLLAGGQVEVTVWSNASSAGSFTVSGSVQAAQHDSNADNNTMSVTLIVPEPTESSSDGGALSALLSLWVFIILIYRRRQV